MASDLHCLTRALGFPHSLLLLPPSGAARTSPGSGKPSWSGSFLPAGGWERQWEAHALLFVLLLISV